MHTILRLLALLSVVLVAACGETTVDLSGTGTQFDPVTGRPVQTQQNVSGKVKRTGIGAPSADGIMNTMTGANAGGGGGYNYGPGGYASTIPGFGGYIPGTVVDPVTGDMRCPRRAPSGAYMCINWYTPAQMPYYSAGGGGFNGSGSGYYYDPRTNRQRQYGFNLMPDGAELTQEEQALFKELERKLELRREEERLSKFQGA